MSLNSIALRKMNVSKHFKKLKTHYVLGYGKCIGSFTSKIIISKHMYLIINIHFTIWEEQRAHFLAKLEEMGSLHYNRCYVNAMNYFADIR